MSDPRRARSPQAFDILNVGGRHLKSRAARRRGEHVLLDDAVLLFAMYLMKFERTVNGLTSGKAQGCVCCLKALDVCYRGGVMVTERVVSSSCLRKAARIVSHFSP